VIEAPRPWYRRGGMHVTEIGYGIMIIAELSILRHDLLGESFGTSSWAFLAGIILCMLIGQRPEGGVNWKCWAYCTLTMPLYFSTALLIPALNYPILCIMSAVVLIVWKIGVCMSVCLHRYAAHQAFRCDPATGFFIHWVGCLANQGGAIWWAAIHRCHHKFCDVDNSSEENPNYVDPHSPVLDGCANAFSFLAQHPTVKEEFVPKHCDNLATRLLDTFAFIPCMVDMFFMYKLFGADGLWVACISGQFSQVLTLYFNVMNHMPALETDAKCKASDIHKPKHMNIFFTAMTQFLWISPLVGENSHSHHHEFGALAHRPGMDLPFHVFIRPLMGLGLVWDVKVKGRDTPSPEVMANMRMSAEQKKAN